MRPTVEVAMKTNGSVTVGGWECNEDQWQCDTGRCIDATSYCDGEVDCWDESDEAACGGCNIDQWQCDGGMCIDASGYCDGEADCWDSSDEAYCECCLTKTVGGKLYEP